MMSITPEMIAQISKLVDNWKLSAADFQLKMVSMVASAILVESIINDFKSTNDINQSVKTVLDVYSETIRSLNARLIDAAFKNAWAKSFNRFNSDPI